MEKKTVQAGIGHGDIASMSKNIETQKKLWQKPRLEDVSGKVMAQPYIRFT
jgi:hypothetical protein